MPAITVHSVTHSSSSRVEYKLPVAVRLVSEDWLMGGSNSKRFKCIFRWKPATPTALSIIYTDPWDDFLRELGGALADNCTLTSLRPDRLF
jgi:hypothetical protein